ncbi:sensor domain-containing diguanylate cyclase [Pseudomonas sp. KU43P]|uniref:sensor domain-containing diguanylate cyclase n=1 Tax=Pseudomonas sp. KU43P TaxID=2487887 RepID=UPI0012A8C701|nr:sensor domain-containing diguanylate cyclase [Pseudomonas sp. KU43P]BBH47813.1 GGDEF domain-containing protein [Pseudomonas sp. KU43P]
MPSRSALFSQRSLILALLMLLACGFLATSLLSYFASRSAIRDGIINTELPLTSDTVYSEIQKDLIRPVLIASMMAQDTFLRDWVLAGEQDTRRITRYLGEVMGKQATFTSFFVSDHTLTYYQAKGVLKQVEPGSWRDAWYFRLRELKAPYEINVDLDMANQDSLTVFINYRVLDYQHRFIGAAGVGLSVDAVVKLIDNYQRRYQRSVFFTDADGKVLLTGSDGGPHGMRVGQNLQGNVELADVLEQHPVPGEGSHEYRDSAGHSHFLNVRQLPELGWYLMVDKRESGSLDRIRHTLYLNLAICTMITLVVLSLLHAMLRRHQASTEALATLDSLTGLPNRRSFDLLAAQALQQAQRECSPLVALLIDLDHFKALNDTHGHLAGDEVLRQFATVLQGSLRQSDILCRWGGEEFIVLLRETQGRQAIDVAQKIRRRTEQLTFSYDEKPLRLTTSIGLSSLQPGDSLHALLSRADHALYRAKQAGRNRVCSETPGTDHE